MTAAQQISAFGLEPAEAQLLADVADGRLPADAEVIYKGRNTLWRFSAPSTGRSIVVKAFHRPHFLNAYVYGNLRSGKARRSYENARRLIAEGFRTPAPIAYAEQRRRLRFCESYYFSEQVVASTLRFIASSNDREAVLRKVAQELAALHSKGIFMRDFSPGNVLYTIGPDRQVTLFYVDLNRMDFGVTSRRRLFENFGAITDDDSVLDELAAYYADAAGFDRATVQADARAARRHYLSKKRFFRRLKQALGLKKKKR